MHLLNISKGTFCLLTATQERLYIIVTSPRIRSKLQGRPTKNLQIYEFPIKCIYLPLAISHFKIAFSQALQSLLVAIISI